MSFRVLFPACFLSWLFNLLFHSSFLSHPSYSYPYASCYPILIVLSNCWIPRLPPAIPSMHPSIRKQLFPFVRWISASIISISLLCYLFPAASETAEPEDKSSAEPDCPFGYSDKWPRKVRSCCMGYSSCPESLMTGTFSPSKHPYILHALCVPPGERRSAKPWPSLQLRQAKQGRDQQGRSLWLHSVYRCRRYRYAILAASRIKQLYCHVPRRLSKSLSLPCRYST